VGAGQGLFVIGPVRRFGALIQAQDDVRPQLLLDGDGLLWSEAMERAVEVGAKGDAIGIHLPQPREAEHLKAAAVGEQWPIPAHEVVQAA